MILVAPKSQQATSLDPITSGTIGVKMSGGADSTILFYILCKTIRDCELDVNILPVTQVYLDRPANAATVCMLVNKIEKMLDVDFILDPLIYYSGRLNNNWEEWHDAMLFQEGIVDQLYNARTAVPKDPISDSIPPARNPFREYPTRERILSRTFHEEEFWKTGDVSHLPLPEDIPVYWREQPFVNVDKRFVAEMYRFNNVEHTLVPMTWSCIAPFSETKGFTKPCGGCFWCKEKEWAFGYHDDQRPNYYGELESEVYNWNPDRGY